MTSFWYVEHEPPSPPKLPEPKHILPFREQLRGQAWLDAGLLPDWEEVVAYIHSLLSARDLNDRIERYHARQLGRERVDYPPTVEDRTGERVQKVYGPRDGYGGRLELPDPLPPEP